MSNDTNAGPPSPPVACSPRNDFVFLVGETPFYVRTWGEERWVFYWHKATEQWVSSRRIYQDEEDCWRQRALSDERAELYHAQHRKNSPQWANASLHRPADAGTVRAVVGQEGE